MNEETYIPFRASKLLEFSENLERLRGIFEEYDSADQSLERLNEVTDDIEDVFEYLISENEELDDRLTYRKDQNQLYQQIIEDMTDKIHELENKNDENTVRTRENVNWGNQVLSNQPSDNLNFGNQVILEDHQSWTSEGGQPNSDDMYEEWRNDENWETGWYDEPEWA
jgi:hypothetical protein